MEATTYVRYSQVKVGDAVKLVDPIIWRDRRTAEKYDAPFLTVASVQDANNGYGDVILTTTDGQSFTKPKTSKALVLA